MKLFSWLLSATIVLSLLLAPSMSMADANPKTELRSPGEIAAQAPADHWRQVQPDNLLLIELDWGTVAVELAPDFAPNHVKQMQVLTQNKFYDGLSFYRVIEGFVAQGGDIDENRPVGSAKATLKAEHTAAINQQMFTLLDSKDGYAPKTGLYKGFMIGQSTNGDQNWLAHCAGAFAFGRNNDPHSASTEFYIVLGKPQRYLDRNLTVFGQVIDGMAHLQKLNRAAKNEAGGVITNPQLRGKIKSMRMASQLPAAQQPTYKVMKTQSASFSELIDARRNRPSEFFIHRPDYVDVCSVGVPIKQES